MSGAALKIYKTNPKFLVLPDFRREERGGEAESRYGGLASQLYRLRLVSRYKLLQNNP